MPLARAELPWSWNSEPMAASSLPLCTPEKCGEWGIIGKEVAVCPQGLRGKWNGTSATAAQQRDFVKRHQGEKKSRHIYRILKAGMIKKKKKKKTVSWSGRHGVRLLLTLIDQLACCGRSINIKHQGWWRTGFNEAQEQHAEWAVWWRAVEMLSNQLHVASPTSTFTPLPGSCSLAKGKQTNSGEMHGEVGS